MEGLFAVLQGLNDNKLMWGVSMIMLNMGSKYVLGDLGTTHERLMNNEWVKKIILMFMFFMATRDIIISFILTVLYVIIVDGILHEKRKFSLFSKDDLTNTISDGKTVQGKQHASECYDRYIQNIGVLYR